MNELSNDPNISILPEQFKFCVLLFICAFPFFVTSCENLSVLPDASYTSEEGLKLSAVIKLLQQNQKELSGK